MPRYSLQDKKARRADQDLQQQQLDQQQMAGMTQQLATMLGLSNESQRLPVELARTEAQTRGIDASTQMAQHQLDWAPYITGLAAQGQEQGLADARQAHERTAQAMPWDETMRQQQYNIGEAQTRGLGAVADQRNQLGPEMLMFLIQQGVLTNDDLEAILPPHLQGPVRQRKQAKQQQNEAARAADQAQQTQTPPRKPRKSIFHSDYGLMPM